MSRPIARVLAGATVALVVLAALGTRFEIRWTDFACPPDTVEHAVGIMDGPVECVRPSTAAYERVAFGFRERFVGWYALGPRARIFDVDLMQDVWHGPALLR